MPATLNTRPCCGRRERLARQTKDGLQRCQQSFLNSRSPAQIIIRAAATAEFRNAAQLSDIMEQAPPSLAAFAQNLTESYFRRFQVGQTHNISPTYLDHYANEMAVGRWGCLLRNAATFWSTLVYRRATAESFSGLALRCGRELRCSTPREQAASEYRLSNGLRQSIQTIIARAAPERRSGSGPQPFEFAAPGRIVAKAQRDPRRAWCRVRLARSSCSSTATMDRAGS